MSLDLADVAVYMSRANDLVSGLVGEELVNSAAFFLYSMGSVVFFRIALDLHRKGVSEIEYWKQRGFGIRALFTGDMPPSPNHDVTHGIDVVVDNGQLVRCKPVRIPVE